MNEWWNLLKKEGRMIRSLMLISLAGLTGGGLWMFYKSLGYSLGVIMAPASLLIIFAMLTPAIYMFSSVTKELKQTPHLWLHCPQPSWMLLSAKLVTAIGFMLSILLLDAAFILLALITQNIPEQAGLPMEQVVWFIAEAGAYGTLAIIGISIYLASWGTLIATVSAASRNWLGRFRGLAGLGVFIAGTWGMGKITHIPIFQTLTQWGGIPIRFQSIKSIFPQQYLEGGPEIFAGQILIFLLFTLALFALSAWLIDNKVEV